MATTPKPEAPKPKAPARSKAEIAKERLDTAQAVVDRITDRITTHENAAQKARDELAGAVERRDFLAGDPALLKGESVTVEAPTATSSGGAVAPGDTLEHTDPFTSGH